MAVDPVTPKPGITSFVAIGGTPVTVVAGGPNGGYITNPYLAADQGFDPATMPENLYVDIVGPATLQGNGTTIALSPGSSFLLVPGQTTVTSVNAATSGHKFTVVSY